MKSNNFLVLLRSGKLTAGIGMCVFGLVLIAAPGAALKLLCILAGILLIIAGGFKLLTYFADSAFRGELIGGILLVLGGIFVISRSGAAIGLTSTIIAIPLLLAALFQLRTASQLRAMAVPGATAITISGAATLLIGILMFFRPIGAASALTVIIGILLLVNGAADMIGVIQASKERPAKMNGKTVIDAEYEDIP